MTDVTEIYAGAAAVATAAVLAPAAAGALGNAAVESYATALTYGIPVDAATIWLLQDSNAANLYKVGNWVNCQINGPC